MYLIKLREFIDARMLDIGTGEGTGADTKSQAAQIENFYYRMLSGAMQEGDQRLFMQVLKKCPQYRNLDAAVFVNLEYFLWYEDEPVFLMRESFHEIYKGYALSFDYKIPILDVYSRASQLMSSFVKMQCRIYEHGMSLHAVCGDRDMDFELYSSSIRILLRYACFLALYELHSAHHPVWFINPLMKLSVDTAGMVLDHMNEMHRGNNGIVLLYNERYASYLHHVL